MSVESSNPQASCKHELLQESKGCNTGNDEFPLQSATALPTLPTELWNKILKDAILMPRFALDVEVDVQNAPQTIEAFHTALTVHSFTNPAFKEFKRTKGSIRPVCRSWKIIADSIYIQTKEHDGEQEGQNESRGENKDQNGRKKRDSAWIMEVSVDKAAGYGPCRRFDTKLPPLTTLLELDTIQEQSRKDRDEYKYKYDVDIVNIQLPFDPSPSSFLSPFTAPRLFIRGVSTMLIRPSTLQAL